MHYLTFFSAVDVVRGVVPAYLKSVVRADYTTDFSAQLKNVAEGFELRVKEVGESRQRAEGRLGRKIGRVIAEDGSPAVYTC